MFKLIYAVWIIHILLTDFFGVSMSAQLLHFLIWTTVGVQVYKYVLIWVLQDKEKAQSIFDSKIEKLTSLGSLPECLIKQHLMPSLIEAITLKNIPHTIAFFAATNLILSYLSLYFASKAVRSVSVHLAFGFYYHYNQNPQLYQSAIEKYTNIAQEQFRVLSNRLKKQQI